jgi:Ser/Thr protein kinase RdoA (MazF antagonist)
MMETLLAAWALPRPWTVRPAGGMNNHSVHVTTPAGDYVLRIYRNTADPRRVGYEHDLLRALQRAGLPFAVPCPVATPTGATTVPAAPEHADGAGRPALAALFPRLPGGPPSTDDLAQVRAAGEALAALHRALARVTLPSALPFPPAVTLVLPASGTLDTPDTRDTLDTLDAPAPDPHQIGRASCRERVSVYV